MALNRYSKLTPLEHTGSFFELPAEMLENAVMARQKQYDAQQEAYDTYLTALSSMEMLPADITISEQRKNELMTKEKALRDQFGGDLASAGYAQQFSDVLRADATDPFYRRATFNLAQTKLWQKAVDDYTAKHGVAPSAWQDPFGANLATYEGATKSTLPVFSGIQQNIAFQPYVIENHLKAYLDREIVNGKVKVINTEAGQIYVNEKDERLGVQEIYDILKQLNLPSSNAYTVLEQQWKSDFNGIRTANPDFNKFYDDNLKSIAAQLAYSTNVQTYAGSTGNQGGSYSTRTAYGNGGPTDQEIVLGLMPSVPLQGALNPTAFENRNQFADYRSNLVSARKTALENSVANVRNIIDMSTLPLDYAAKVDVIPDNTSGSNNKFRVQLTYTDNGEQRSVDLSSPEILLDQRLPPDLKNRIRNGYGQIVGVASELKAYDYAIEQANKLDEIAFESGFGVGSYAEFRRSETGWLDRYKKEYESNPNGFIEDSKLGDTRAYLRNLPNMQANLATIQSNFTRQTLAAAASRSNAADVYGGTGTSTRGNELIINPIEHLMTIGTKALGIPPSELEQFKNTPDVKTLYDRIMQDYDPDKAAAYQTRFDNYLAYEAFKNKKDSKFTKYLNTFQDHWKVGISADGEPLYSSTGGSAQGMRQNEKRLYSFNVNATTDGGRFNGVMSDLINSVLPGSNLFDVETNTRITDEDRQRFQLTSSGKPNYTISGFTFDDEGMNAIVTLYGDVDRELPPKTFEIRGVGSYISNSVGNLGLKGGVMLGAIDSMLSGFLTEEKSASQLEGQKRSNPVSMITAGAVKLPVTKAITTQYIDGRVVEEGTFIYKPMFGKPTVYSADPMEVAQAAFEDASMIETLMNPSEILDIKQQNLPNVTISESIVREGRTSGTMAINKILTDIASLATGTTLNITSLNRFGNQTSAHTFGDAVDLSLMRNGQVDQVAVNAVKQVATTLQSNPATAGLYDVLIEFQKEDDTSRRLREQLAGTSVKVMINSKASGPHIHIEFNRANLIRR